MDRLRLRTAYGKAGVQPSTIAALQFLGAAAFPTGAAADEPGLRIASIGNQNLKPEVTTEYEGGFDVGFLDGRINVEATMFRKLSKDALFNRPLPPSYGTAIGSASPTQWQNLAAVENKGTELTDRRADRPSHGGDAGTFASTDRCSRTSSSTPAACRSRPHPARATRSAIRCSGSGIARSPASATRTATA